MHCSSNNTTIDQNSNINIRATDDVTTTTNITLDSVILTNDQNVNNNNNQTAHQQTKTNNTSINPYNSYPTCANKPNVFLHRIITNLNFIKEAIKTANIENCNNKQPKSKYYNHVNMIALRNFDRIEQLLSKLTALSQGTQHNTQIQINNSNGQQNVNQEFTTLEVMNENEAKEMIESLKEQNIVADVVFESIQEYVKELQQNNIITDVNIKALKELMLLYENSARTIL